MANTAADADDDDVVSRAEEENPPLEAANKMKRDDDGGCIIPLVFSETKTHSLGDCWIANAGGGDAII